MINEPDYNIRIGDSGEIVIIRNKDLAVFSGNYETDDQIREFCNILSLKSKTRKCIAQERDNPIFEVHTIVSSVERDNGTTRVNVLKNPFIESFTVNADDFQFSEGQHIFYTDSNPPEMRIENKEKATTIIHDHNMGWIRWDKYEYHQLNEASRAVYDILIKEADHRKLVSFLQDVEKIYNGKDETALTGKSDEYANKALALAEEYKKIRAKTTRRRGESRMMHPDDVRDSVIVKQVKDYVPSYIATSTNLPSRPLRPLGPICR